jgi:hypothetical protein
MTLRVTHEVLERNDPSVPRVGIVFLPDPAPRRPGVIRYHVPQSMRPVEQPLRVLFIVCALERNNFQPVRFVGEIGVLFEVRRFVLSMMMMSEP